MTGAFSFPAELRMVQDTVADFVRRELRPIEQSLPLAATCLPAEAVSALQQKARTAGLWQFAAPEEFGGAGQSPFEYVVTIEAAAQHAFSVPTPGGGAFGYDVPRILLKGSEEQIRRYYEPSVREGTRWFVAITEPAGGSDPARSIRTVARRTGDTWVISGTKSFISAVGEARYGVVFARTSGGGPNGRGITAFIVPRDAPGLSYRFNELIRDEGAYDVLFEDVQVPLEDQLGPEGAGFELAQEWMIRSRLTLSAVCLGIASASLAMAVEYAKTRETFGAALATRQAVQWMLADSEVELRAARWLLWDAAWRLEHGESGRYETSIAKLYATEAGSRVVDRAIQIFGGMGVSREMPLERWYRAVRTQRIVEGPSEIHRFLIAREMLGSAALGRPAQTPARGAA